MATTIKEIAAKLGISRGTVDRVIHNRGKVSPEVRAQVMKVIDELDYRPNRAGRMLAAAKQPRRIGAVFPGIGNEFFDEVVRGMEDAAAEYEDLGFSLVTCPVKGYDPDEHLKAIESLVEDGVDGLLAATVQDGSVISCLSSLSIPSAAFNSDLSYDKKLYYVGSDYAEKGRLNAGMLMLAAKGKPRIVIIRGSEKISGHSQIGESFMKTLRDAGFEHEIIGNYSTMDDDDITEEVLSRLLASTDADTVFITTAGLNGAVRAIGDRKDILLFTSDDTPAIMNHIKNGKVAWTVSQEPYQQGSIAVKHMIDYFIYGTVPGDYITRNIIRIRES